LSYPKRIAIDAMGGDSGVDVTVPAALQALEKHPGLELHLVGDSALIEPLLGDRDNQARRQRLTVQHTDAVVRDEDRPTRVLRDRTVTSMFRAVQLVQEGTVSACVSAGNTGSLLLCGRHLLKTARGIDKPAIMAIIPGATRHCYLLDVGANVDCQAAQLFQFAVMGSVLAESLDGLAPPRVALLNIGVEDYKGNEQVRAAASLLEQCREINYIGYVEGSALFEGKADVVVCDGFVGNVTIKSSAGVVRVIDKAIAEIVAADQENRRGAGDHAELIAALQQRVDPGQFNGASLLGLQGIIIKSHGNAGSRGFSFAIDRAVREVDNMVPDLIAARVGRIMDRQQHAPLA